jgi:hypothetical protein
MGHEQEGKRPFLYLTLGDTYQKFHPDQLPIQTVQVDRIVKTGTIFRILRSSSHLFPIG